MRDLQDDGQITIQRIDLFAVLAGGQLTAIDQNLGCLKDQMLQQGGAVLGKGVCQEGIGCHMAVGLDIAKQHAPDGIQVTALILAQSQGTGKKILQHHDGNMDRCSGQVHTLRMMDAMQKLQFFTLLFVGGHFLLSSLAVRRALEGKLGQQGYRGLYSLFALATFAMMLLFYGEAPFEPVWEPAPALRMVPTLLMPLACILLVSSLTTPNVTLVGGEKLAEDPSPVPGIMTITRHPFLWGAALWSVGHLTVNGDQASMTLFGGILVLSIGGMLHIDHRREATLGSAWGPVAMASSLLPFHAILQGRAKLDWKGIGLWRVAAGLALFALLLGLHEWIAGVPLF